jgi:hypothetical protein
MGGSSGPHRHKPGAPLALIELISLKEYATSSGTIFPLALHAGQP